MKNNSMDKKKAFDRKKIVIFIFAILITAIIFMILSKDSAKYIIINNDTLIAYKDGTYSELDFTDSKHRNKNYRLFYESEYIGNYRIDEEVFTEDGTYDGIYYTNKDSNQKYTFSVPNIAFTNDIELLPFEVQDFDYNDLLTLKNVLGKTYIDSLNQLDYATKIIHDIDGDGEDEIIYNVLFYELAVDIEDLDNLEEDIVLTYPRFSLLYVQNGSELEVLKESVATSFNDDLYEYNVEYLLNVDGDEACEMVISFTNYDILEYAIYEYENNYHTLLTTGESVE